MRDNDAVINEIERLLGRLACDVVLDEAGEARALVARDLKTAAGRLEASGVPALATLAQAIRRVAEDGASTAEASLAAAEALWADWKHRQAGAEVLPSSTAPADVPAAATVLEEDDLEGLRADQELAGMFVAEALDHLGTIEATVLELETTPGDRKLLDDVFRPFHTIKGNAGALGVTSVQQLAHRVENLLDLARSGRHHLGGAEIECILRAVDVLTSMIADLPARLEGKPGRDVRAARAALLETLERLLHDPDEPAPVPVDAWPSGPPPARAAEPAATQLGPEAPVTAAAATETTADAAGSPGEDAEPETPAARAAAPNVSAPAPAPPKSSVAVNNGLASVGITTASVKVDTLKLDNLVDMVGELVIVQSLINQDPALQRALDERLTRNLSQLRRITSDLQRSAMSMRMVPIRQTFQKMARLVRDLSKKSGKSVELVLSGEDTELDRRVVEDINDPLMHMIRNSFDHGIEPAADRRRAGKPPRGRISLSAYHQAGSIVICVGDDGSGLKTEKIRAKAEAKGLVGPTDALTPSEIHHLIFHPGFSTADQVTEISGRGVGMDVVRRNIEILRGRIEIQSTPGAGTTFVVKLPLTLAILDGLLVRVGTERYVLPTFCIQESLRPLAEQVHHVQGEPRMIQVRNSMVPLLRLADLFGVPGAAESPLEATVIVIEDDGRRVGLVVDELLGKQEVVIKSLGQAFSSVRGVAGGAILGDGRIGLILDAGGILALSGQGAARAA